MKNSASRIEEIIPHAPNLVMFLRLFLSSRKRWVINSMRLYFLGLKEDEAQEMYSFKILLKMEGESWIPAVTALLHY